MTDKAHTQTVVAELCDEKLSDASPLPVPAAPSPKPATEHSSGLATLAAPRVESLIVDAYHKHIESSLNHAAQHQWFLARFQLLRAINQIDTLISFSGRPDVC